MKNSIQQFTIFDKIQDPNLKLDELSQNEIDK